MNKFISILFVFVSTFSFGQSFAPEPGQIGSTAIAADSNSILFWANAVVVNRGPMDIMNPGLGNAIYGIESDAIGPADGVSVVSLGDGGEAVLSFAYPISNGPGPDFAIFENGFLDHYMELGYVEVSSDGVNFFRFENTSEIPTDTQLSNFDTSNCGYVNNLAGKYRAYYGTPFDLDEMTGFPLLDVNNVTHVRIIDVVGSINPLYGSQDSQGNIINDPYPTPWESSGFDLDGVAVLNSAYAGLDTQNSIVNIFPNPFTFSLKIETNESGELEIFNSMGQKVSSINFEGNTVVTLNEIEPGNYVGVLSTIHGKSVRRIVKL